MTLHVGDNTSCNSLEGKVIVIISTFVNKEVAFRNAKKRCCIIIVEIMRYNAREALRKILKAACGAKLLTLVNLK